MSSVLVLRLPLELQLIAGREVKGDWNLPDILKILSRELEARERTYQEGLLPLTHGESHVVKRKAEKASVAT